MGDSGVEIPKPKAQWTTEEKNLSKFNARALNVIFAGVGDDQFKLIQGCRSAKQAWDTLQKAHEGTTKVKQTRLDQLASRFENLKMQPDETIVQFSSKISAIANEAEVLGKHYKEHKLVKKLLRCLPQKFAAHKAVMRVSGDIESLKFDELVGMLKSEEMETEEDSSSISKGKGIAFQVADEQDEIQELKDNMSLLAKSFARVLRRSEKSQGKQAVRWNQDSEKSKARNQQVEGNKSGYRKEVTCYDCKGVGHISTECPTSMRRDTKCLECRGFGHNKFECPNTNKRKEKSLLVHDETETDGEDEDDMVNMVAFVSDTAGNKILSDAESDSDDDEIDPIKDYRCLYNSWVEAHKDKLQLTRDKLKLEAQVQMLEEDDSSEWKLQLLAEKEKSASLQRELDETYKKVRMLNQGSQKLDEILQVGRLDNSHRGLGYCGFDPSASTSNDFSSRFVKKGTMAEEGCRLQNRVTVHQVPQPNCVDLAGSLTKYQDKVKFIGRSRVMCGHCNEKGHSRNRCNQFKEHIMLLWNLQKCFLEPSQFGCVWVTKRDLYTKQDMWRELLEVDRQYETANCIYRIQRPLQERQPQDWVAFVAYTAETEDKCDKWYFDSGCSRHMTGSQSALEDYTIIERGNVTFGGGAQGKIRGKGNLCNSEQPRLSDVYFVDGLKANLISISQLCDNILEVVFTKKDCRAIDEKGTIVLSGTKSSNNCYMWKKDDICMKAVCSDIDLWHMRLGHLNTRSLMNLSQLDAVEGLPHLKGTTDTVCRACNQGKQIRVQHRRCNGITSEKVLELIHMDLMGPVQVESLNGKRYVFVLVDDFSRFTWVRFLRDKSEALWVFRILALLLKNIKGPIQQIRSDRGGEFLNEEFRNFCGEQGINH